jgi:hypothetical protein
MKICMERFDLCLRFPAAKKVSGKLSNTDLTEWADHLPNNPQALLAHSREMGLKLYASNPHH